MSVMHVLDHTGDTTHEWDPNNEAEVAAMRAVFDQLVGEKHYLAYTVPEDGSRGEVIRDFRPDAARMTLTPQLQGG